MHTLNLSFFFFPFQKHNVPACKHKKERKHVMAHTLAIERVCFGVRCKRGLLACAHSDAELVSSMAPTLTAIIIIIIIIIKIIIINIVRKHKTKKQNSNNK